MRCRVLIVDKHTIIRYGIAAMLRRNPHFRVVDEACCDAAILQLTASFRPHVLILGVHATAPPVHALIRLLRESTHAPRVLCIGDRADPYFAQAIIDTGVHAYLCSAVSLQELTEAVYTVAAGRQIQIVPVTEQHDVTSPLGTRERQILIEVAKGLPNKAIARQHGISVRTVGNHLQHIFRKLEASNRMEAVLHARQQGLLQHE
jgi:DNA-binding NarL/FixJ family response regulator